MRRTNSFWRRLHLLPLLLIFSGILSACAEPPVTVDTITLQELQVLPLPIAAYSAVVWLDEETLVFKHRRPRTPAEVDEVDGFDDYHISLYRLDTQELQKVQLPTPPSHCAHGAGRFGTPHGVPGKRFGYIYLCHDKFQFGVSSILYLWDREQNRMVEYTTYPKPFSAGRFSFAADMSSLLQIQATGVSPELYFVDADGVMTQLFSEFERVYGPGRSPDGKTVAFIGNERYPFDTGEYTSLSELNRKANQLGDLYLMDADGSNARLVLPQVGRSHNLTWSPDGAYLFFSGTSFWGLRGIWMLHLDTLEGTQIWPFSVKFALSPDGRRILININDSTYYRTPTQPTLFALPYAP